MLCCLILCLSIYSLDTATSPGTSTREHRGSTTSQVTGMWNTSWIWPIRRASWSSFAQGHTSVPSGKWWDGKTAKLFAQMILAGYFLPLFIVSVVRICQDDRKTKSKSVSVFSGRTSGVAATEAKHYTSICWCRYSIGWQISHYNILYMCNIYWLYFRLYRSGQQLDGCSPH